MIVADLSNKGMIKVAGTTDEILTEYTVVTRVILNQLTSDFNKEKAFNILATIGQLAAEDIDNVHADIDKIYKTINEVYHEES